MVSLKIYRYDCKIANDKVKFKQVQLHDFDFLNCDKQLHVIINSKFNIYIKYFDFLKKHFYSCFIFHDPCIYKENLGCRNKSVEELHGLMFVLSFYISLKYCKDFVVYNI